MSMRWVGKIALPIAAVGIVALGGYQVAAQRTETARLDAAIAALEQGLAAASSAAAAPVTSTGSKAYEVTAQRRGIEQDEQEAWVDMVDRLVAAHITLHDKVSRLEQALASEPAAFAIDHDAAILEEQEHFDTADDSLQGLQSSFDADGDDPQWRVSAERNIDTAMADVELPGTRLTDRECRGSLCRLEVQFDDERARVEAAPFLPQAIPWDGESFVFTEADGRTVMFVARSGYGLDGEPTPDALDE